MSRLLALTLLSSTVLLAPHAASADSCTAARVMVILDKSSSMQTGMVGTQTKWQVAVNGLGQVLSTYEQKAEFGLVTFPRAGMCSPGQVDVAPAKGNRTSILGALTTPPPEGGNYTPMAQTLEAAAQDPALQTTGARHVILITDGWQYCVPYDPQTRFDGVPAVETLTQQGVTTWVVGFGAEVDPVALNRMAVAANTAKAGCNPNSTDAAAPDNCYFQVDNTTELVQALTAIAGSISSGETCDGVDNDCNGQIDDGLSRSCSNACGVGTESCHAGNWDGCDAPQPKTETCDGIDNDCDGQVDEPDASLCDSGEVCVAGACQPGNGNGDGEVHAGCSCDAHGMPSAGALAPWLAVGLLMIRRRRR